MKSSQAERAFRKRLGRVLESVTPRQVFEAMFAFYAEQRAEDVSIENDGDMLLYEWGVYRFSGPEMFQLSITRQFVVTDDDGDEPYQLRLTMHFEPTQALRQLGRGDKWCHSPDELQAIKQFAESSTPFRMLAATQPAHLELYFEQC